MKPKYNVHSHKVLKVAVDANSILPGYYALSTGKYLPTFRNVLVPSSSKSSSPKITFRTSEKIYALAMHNILENLNLHEM
jgi:hypothetical protein